MLQVKKDFEFDADQQAAVDLCCDRDKRIVAITGPSGCGKTSIIEEVYNYYVSIGLEPLVIAPTGKAAKRITEVTGIPAMTTHRALEYPMPGEIDQTTGKVLVGSYPRRDKRHPFDNKIILADEYAMFSNELHRNVLDALPNSGIIRMFGDANQLQPIETSKFLMNKPSSFENMLNKFDSVRLKTIHRQEAGSSIITNGNRILSGLLPIKKPDYDIVMTEQPVEKIMDLVYADPELYKGLNHQIITPTNKGWVGTMALNATIQGLVQSEDTKNTDIERHQWSDTSYQRIFIGDKIIFTRNNYGLGIFNGEVGIVSSIVIGGDITIDLGDRSTDIPPFQEVESRKGIMVVNPQKDIELAYVTTTHKTQGSEYDSVTYVMNRSRSYLLCRSNLYTGTTRARTFVRIISDQQAMGTSLRKVRT